MEAAIILEDYIYIKTVRREYLILFWSSFNNTEFRNRKNVYYEYLLCLTISI